MTSRHESSRHGRGMERPTWLVSWPTQTTNRTSDVTELAKIRIRRMRMSTYKSVRMRMRMRLRGPIIVLHTQQQKRKCTSLVRLKYDQDRQHEHWLDCIYQWRTSFQRDVMAPEVNGLFTVHILHTKSVILCDKMKFSKNSHSTEMC